jgi:hypothetical protein
VGAEAVACPRLPDLCVDAGGFNLHAGVQVIAGRRERLLGLCRYLLRPPLSHERVEQRPDGKILLKLKRAWHDGTRALLFDPLELLGRLAAIVPPPRRHLVHYYGVLGPHSSWRREIVPDEPEAAAGASGHEVDGCRPPQGPSPSPSPSPSKRSRTCWAELMRKTFAIDVLACSCGGRMRYLCAVFDPDALQKIEQSLKRRESAAPARPSAQLPLFPKLE